MTISLHKALKHIAAKKLYIQQCKEGKHGLKGIIMWKGNRHTLISDKALNKQFFDKIFLGQ